MSSSHDQDPSNPAFIADEVLIKFHDEVAVDLIPVRNGQLTNHPDVNFLLKEMRAQDISNVYPGILRDRSEKTYFINGKEMQAPRLDLIFRIKVEAGRDIPSLAKQLSLDPLVEFAEPNYIIYSVATFPDDPIYLTGAQWHIDTVKAPQAWDLNRCDTNQVIGILDTGVDWGHPDLNDNIWTNWNEIPDNGIDDDGNGFVDDIRGWDFVNIDNDPDDDNSHGTHVAGIAAAETDNATGIAGIAWYAMIMPVKFLQSSGQGNSADFAAAITYAAENGATVINMSVGSFAESMTVKLALEYAYSTSILIAAAGNDGYFIDYMPMYPACYSFVLGVEASDFYNDITEFSNFDEDGPYESIYPDLKNYEIRAPGYGIYSTFPDGSYYALSGTSMACPIVAGATAILNSHHPGITHEELFVRLIQGSENHRLDLYKSLTLTPIPDLRILDYSIYDTLPGCDHDGLPDAGESIVINVNIRNVGGYADSVWAHFTFRTYEDTNVAVISDSLSTIGDISAYASLPNDLDPFILTIDSNVIHNRDIVFTCIVSNKEGDTVSEDIVITVQRAEELAGIMDTTMYLTPDKLWLVNNSFRISSTGHMIILPGTHIILNEPVINWGQVTAHGTPDSLIRVSGSRMFEIGYYNLSYLECTPGTDIKSVLSTSDHIMESSSRSQCYVQNCSFYGGSNFILHNATCIDCNFFSCGFNNWTVDTILMCNFYNNGVGLRIFDSYEYIAYSTFSNIRNNNIIYGGHQFYKNNFITNLSTTSYYCNWGNAGIYSIIPLQYWGTIDTTIIDQMIVDFYDVPSFPICVYQPILETPSDSAHGFPWKVHINDQNPQGGTLDPVGPDTVKFDVFFNRAMDTVFKPFLTFGVREPYTQHIVVENSSWNPDSTVWTAYFVVGLETGDGINFIRVAETVDNEGFISPIEDNKRFFFTIQAAGAASLTFNAIPGIGMVDLEWQTAPTPDVMGYNLYRFFNLTDTTYSDTIKINSGLLTDTSYTDYLVIPDTTYNYVYTVIGTDLQESDFSKVATAIPQGTIDGDANGDGNVDVMDVTTIINHILENNPMPFLFEEADMNNDNQITVADIVGVINIITGSSDGTKNPARIIPSFGEVFPLDKTIAVKSTENLTAIMLEIDLAEAGKLSVSSLLEGFEMATRSGPQSMTCIIYSLSGREIPSSLTSILDISLQTTQITTIMAEGATSEGALVRFKDYFIQQGPLQQEMSVAVNPNPFTYSTLIHIDLPDTCTVSLSIVDIHGKIITKFAANTFSTGRHTIRWEPNSQPGANPEKGIYLVEVKAKAVNRKGKVYHVTKKVIYR